MRQGHTGDLLESEHPASRDVPVHDREPCFFTFLEIPPEDVGIAPFVHEIQLMRDGFGELRNDTSRIEWKIHVVLGDPLGDFVQNLHVGLDRLLDAGAKDLQHDMLAVLLHCTVRLSDRCGGQNVLVDRYEMCVEVTQLGNQLGVDLVPGLGGYFALQLLELDDPISRKDVGPCTENLPELDERRTKFLQRMSHAGGTRQRLRLLVLDPLLEDLLTLVTEQVQLRFVEKLLESIFDCHRQQLTVAVGVLDG